MSINPIEIINFVRDLKNTLKTSNPYEIAEYYGICVLERNFMPIYPAVCHKLEQYPTIIAIDSRYDDFSKKVLCGHELAHALLHANFMNTYGTSASTAFEPKEYEANLFAIALLSDDDEFINELPAYTGFQLKAIMDNNIHLV